MAAGISAQERRIVELVLKATGDADLKRMTAELRQMRGAAEQSQKSLSGIGAGLSSVTKFATGFIGALGISSVISWTHAILDAADALDAAAEQAGIGVERYQTLKQAFQALEVNAREFEGGIERLGVALSEYISGESTAATKALDRLGIGAKIAGGEIYDVEGLVDALASSTKALNDDMTFTADLADIVGRKLAGDYSSAFRSGALATEELRVATETFGIVSKEELETLAEASQTVDEAYNTVSNAILTMTANVINGVKAMHNSLSDENFAAIVENLNNYQGSRAGNRAGPVMGALEDMQRAAAAAAVASNRAARVTPARRPGGGGGSGAAQASERARAAAELERQAMEGLGRALETLNEQRQQAADAQAARVAEGERLADIWRQNNQTILDQEAARLEATAKAQAEAAELVRDQWGYVADSFGQATYDIITDTESVSQAVKRMVASILAELARIAAVKLAAQIVGSLFGQVPGAPIGGNVTAFAAGGIINGPTAFAMGGGIGIAGERGAEVIAPLRRDGSGNMGVGAVAPRVVVNNYAGADVAVQPTRDGVQIDIMRRVIADDIRRGGNPVSQAIEGAYRVGRQAAAFG